MRKTIVVFATALAVWWAFGPVVAAMKHTDPKRAKAEQILKSAFTVRGMQVVPDQIEELAETICMWDEQYWEIAAINMVKIALGELTPEQSQQMMQTIIAITEEV